MKKTITSIDPFSAARVMALLYLAFSLPFMLIMYMVSRFAPGQAPMGLLMLVLMPIIYALVGFVFTLIGAWLYNLIAKTVGGIEYESAEVDEA